jgi:hypothetical protein
MDFESSEKVWQAMHLFATYMIAHANAESIIGM